eukprot:scaffold5865_cov127-Skeletonema_menzelii.AAC.2
MLMCMMLCNQIRIKSVDRGPGAGGRSEEGRKVKTPQFRILEKSLTIDLDHVGHGHVDVDCH